VVALVIAPLWAPLFATPYASHSLFTAPPQWPWVVLIGLMTAAVTYLSMGLIGIPAYLWLRRRPDASIGLAAMVGAAAASLSWVVFLFAFHGLAMVRFPNLNLMVRAAIAGGWRYQAGVTGLGALIGATFWIIARPDVRSRTGPLMFADRRFAALLVVGPIAGVALWIALVVAANVGVDIRLPNLN